MPVARRLVSLFGVHATGAGVANGSRGDALASWQVRLASGTMDGMTVALEGRIGPDYAFEEIDRVTTDSTGKAMKWASAPIAMFELRLNIIEITNAGTAGNLPSIYGDIWVM